MNGQVGAAGTGHPFVDQEEDDDDEEKDGFVMPSEVVEVAGLLFDMDGTIIDSTNAVVKHWTQIGDDLGIDPNVILATSHGRRSIDVLRVIDPANATLEYVSRVESQLPRKYGQDAVEIPGARALLDSLNEQQVPWTIVTSGTRGLVGGWIEALSLPRPHAASETEKQDESSDYMSILVTAEDVDDGKPDPACYNLGRQRLFGADEISQVESKSKMPILVLEDAPAGIQAGYETGCRVVALATSHTVQQLENTKAEWIVRDMRSVKLLGVDTKTGIIRVEISKGLKR